MRLPVSCLLACGFCFAARAAEVKGRIVEQHSGLPVEQAQVLVLRLPHHERSATAETDDEGAFRATGLTSGRYRIEASKPGFAPSALYVSVTADTSVFIRLAKAGAISGHVVAEDGTPVRDASVLALARPPGSSALRRFGAPMRVDDRGQYRLHGLPAGEYAVGVSYSGVGTSSGPGAVIIPGTFSVVSGEDHQGVNLTVTPGAARSIEGRVAPTGGSDTVLVTLALQNRPDLAVAQTLAQKDGGFRFGPVRAGSYLLFAAGPSDPRLNAGFGGLLGQDPFFGRAEVSVMDQDAKGMAVLLHPGRSVSFRVGAADPSVGDLACGVKAVLQLTGIDAWGAHIDRSVEVDAESAATVSGLAPARYSMTLGGLPASCYYVGDPSLDLTATVPETVLLRVAPAASLEGRLMPGAQATRAAHIVLMWTDSEPVSLVAVPDSEGRFTMESIRPGNYRALVLSLAEWSGRQWRPDANRMLPLRLTPGITSVEIPVPGAP